MQARFTKVAVPDAKGFGGSAEKHRFIGLCADAERARQDGPVQVSTAFCGCAKCTAWDFSNCLMREVGGMATRLTRELVPSISLSGAPSQSTTLAEFASELQVNELRALRVDDPERGLEGSWWLCLIMGPAVQATKQQAHATDLFEEGWWIVEIMWYEYVQGSKPRAYKLKRDSRRWLVVNAFIRVDGLSFVSSGEGGQRALRSGMCILSNASQELIESCL